MTAFSHQERLHYMRHLTLPGVGERGQQRLKESSVLVVGAGGLGSALLSYLAAAGVGRIGIVDDDAVDASNLHRQILYGMSTLGTPKVDAAAARLQDLNPHVHVEKHKVRFSPQNARALVEAYDVVADGTDNFATRYWVNDACVQAGKVNVFASIFQFEGQVSVFGASVDGLRGPCYRCFHPTPPPQGTVPSCAEAGVFGILPGVMGALQATEVLKILLRLGDVLIGRVLFFDALTMSFRTIVLERAAQCAVCGEQPERLHSCCEFPRGRDAWAGRKRKIL